MQYRKFTIENGDGNTIALAESTSKIFLNNPSGLGINNTITTNNYPDKMNVVNNEQSFGSIGGEMVFYDYINKDKYQAYNDFITFLMVKPLKLYYELPIPKTYSIDIDLLTIEKTEVKNDGLLRCNFTFQTLSRWKGETIKITGSDNTYQITNNGHMPVGFKITINSNGLNKPYIKLIQDNILYGEAKITRSLVTTMYINSIDGENELNINNLGGYSTNLQDLSISNGSIYVTFMKIARGVSTLEIGMDGGTIDSVEIEYTPLYRSV